MPTLTKLISMKEASEHTSKDDCWVVIDGKVYDVTSYLEEHPGGEEALLEATAKDATDDFEDAGHSNEARELLEAFCIGELDESPPTIIPELEVFPSKQFEGCAEKLVDIRKQYWVVPAAVIGLSMVVGFLYLRKK